MWCSDFVSTSNTGSGQHLPEPLQTFCLELLHIDSAVCDTIHQAAVKTKYLSMGPGVISSDQSTTRFFVLTGWAHDVQSSVILLCSAHCTEDQNKQRLRFWKDYLPSPPQAIQWVQWQLKCWKSFDNQLVATATWLLIALVIATILSLRFPFPFATLSFLLSQYWHFLLPSHIKHGDLQTLVILWK